MAPLRTKDMLTFLEIYAQPIVSRWLLRSRSLTMGRPHRQQLNSRITQPAMRCLRNPGIENPSFRFSRQNRNPSIVRTYCSSSSASSESIQPEAKRKAEFSNKVVLENPKSLLNMNQHRMGLYGGDEDGRYEMLFVEQGNLVPGTLIRLDSEQAKHLRARRSRAGELIDLFDGKGTLATGEIMEEPTKKSRGLEIRVIEVQKYPEAAPKSMFHLTAAIAMPRSSTRCDWLIEKLTELGIDAIVPLTGDYSQNFSVDARMERWYRLSIAACKQSLRLHLPQIAPNTEVSELIDLMESLPNALKLVAAPDGSPISALYTEYISSFENEPMNAEGILFACGPPGGFSDDEVADMIIRGGAKKVALGPLRLRSETAIVALASGIALLTI